MFIMEVIDHFIFEVPFLFALIFFNKQLGSGISPESCLYFQGFRSSKLLNVA